MDSQHHQLVLTIVSLLESRNPFNLDHCKLTARYAGRLAEKAGMKAEKAGLLRRAAEIHTLGVLLQIEEKRKHLWLPAACANPGGDRNRSSLAREEAILNRTLRGSDELEACIPVILQRHECYDGSGLPEKLKGDGIPVESRALAVADAFVDLVTPKSHRQPATVAEVLRRMDELTGRWLDPYFVGLLKECVAEESWSAAERARWFQAARCRHWLSLGHFFRQSGQKEWALRSFLQAERLAEEMQEPEQVVKAVSGQFMIFCDTGDLESARSSLQRLKNRGMEDIDSCRPACRMMWGLLEWKSGREKNGRQILESLAEEQEKDGNILPMAETALLLSATSLFQDGQGDETHLKWLNVLMELLGNHDLLDLILEHRGETIPLFLSSILNGVRPELSKSFLTLMGEPYLESFGEKLDSAKPDAWMSVIQPDSPVPTPKVEREAAKPGLRRDRPPSLRVLCLGNFLIEANGKTFSEEDWPTQKAMKLFAFLAFRKKSQITDEKATDLFWPDRDPARAGNSLRNAIHQIRSVLTEAMGDPLASRMLTHSKKTHSLAFGPDYFLDTEEFEESLEQAGILFSQGKHQEALERCGKSLSLYRGDFLERVRDEWAEPVRTHFFQARLRALHLLCKCRILLGDPEGAEVAARSAIALDDLFEEAHAALIEALLAQRRQADAIRHYHEAVAHFKKEIGASAPMILSALSAKLMQDQ